MNVVKKDEIRFATKEIHFLDKEIHLVRNGYCYKKLQYSDIDRMEILIAREIRRWYILLIFGILLVLFGLYLTVNFALTASISVIFNPANSSQVRGIGGYIGLALFFLVFGAVAVYVSLLRTPVIRIKSQQKWYHFSLNSINKENKINELIEYLIVRVDNKVHSEVL